MAISQSIKPSVNMARTVRYFDEAHVQKLGSDGGKVELRESGILVHPGSKEPSEVVFNISDEKGYTTLAAWIAPLPAAALASKEAGVAAVQLFLDSAPMPRREVSRHDNLYFTFDASGASKLKVVADCANGTALFDWLFIGVM